jgi:hypothetical protein
MSDFALSQLIVAIALLFDLSSVQMQERRHLIIGQMIAGSLIATHFFLLDQITAGCMFTLGAIRLLISLKWQGKTVRLTFYALIILAAAWTSVGLISVIACLASLTMATGAFSTSLKKLRLYFITGSSIWLLHNLMAWTPVGIVMEILFLSSNLLGYYRFFIRQPKADQAS